MTLKDLWHSLVEKATAEEQALAAQFHEHIEELDATITEAIPFKEYPKWVGNKVVASKEEEDALKESAAPASEPAPSDPLVPSAPLVVTPEGDKGPTPTNEVQQ